MSETDGRKRYRAQQRHLDFVREYLVDHDMVRAYRAAGYKPGNDANAKKGAQLLLDHPDVLAEIRRRQAEMAPKIEARIQKSAEDVADLLAKQAFGSVDQILEWDETGKITRVKPSAELTDADRAVLAEYQFEDTDNGPRIKLKTVDKLQAARALGQHLGMFVTRNENLNINASLADLTAEQLEQRIAERLKRLNAPEAGG